ncbi:MAG: hypothetical protein BACD_00131 [Bacteroides rodentium]
MITQKEINSLDRKYFTVIHAGCYGVTLQSKNTLHSWYIACKDLGYRQSFRIDHSHGGPYTQMHHHGGGKTLQSCIRQIKSHDEYQLKKTLQNAATADTAGRKQESPQQMNLSLNFKKGAAYEDQEH